MPFHNDLMINLMKMHAASQDQSYSFSKIAWVKDYDPATNCVKVGYFNINTKDFDLMSGWLPILSPSLGRGDDSENEDGDTWGFVHPPNIGEQVVVTSRNGDFTNGVVTGALFSDVVPPPKPDGDFTEMGEFLWCHKTGSYLKFHNSGDITIVTDRDLNVHVKRNANVLIEGDGTVELNGKLAIYVAGDAMVVSKGNITAYGKSLTANVTGNTTLNTESVTANVLGSMTANIGGSLTVGANGDIGLTSLGIMTLEALGGINFITDGNIISVAAGAITDVEGATVPPPIPLIIPPIPSAPEPPDLLPLFGGQSDAPPTPTPPPPTPVPPSAPGGLGSNPGISGLFSFGTTPTGTNFQWNAPL